MRCVDKLFDMASHANLERIATQRQSSPRCDAGIRLVRQ